MEDLKVNISSLKDDVLAEMLNDLYDFINR